MGGIKDHGSIMLLFFLLFNLRWTQLYVGLVRRKPFEQSLHIECTLGFLLTIWSLPPQTTWNNYQIRALVWSSILRLRIAPFWNVVYSKGGRACLPRWFVQFLDQIGKVKKQASIGTLSQTSDLFIWCIYLEECRLYVLISNVMASIRKEKLWSERCPFDREGRGVKSYLGNAHLNGPLFKKWLP